MSQGVVAFDGEGRAALLSCLDALERDVSAVKDLHDGAEDLLGLCA